MAENTVEKTRRRLTGIVVSDKMDKTITVEVSTYKNDPIYGKRAEYRKKYKAHDEKEEANVGDTVLIEETRHIAATVYFRLVKVLKKGEAQL
ncbi:MAG: 30S ribosomal protein S17 [Bacilli bacterium]|jgi:small subunit ribosomal protein S17|nr:30S ribosomal protein S17 [Bacilli bacterium]